MEHGFNIFKIVCLVMAILLFWGIRDAIRIAPQVRETANQVASINDLKNIDFKIGGCIPVRGSL